MGIAIGFVLTGLVSVAAVLYLSSYTDVTHGDGWQLLAAAGKAGIRDEPRAEIIPSASALADAWQSLGLNGEPDGIDFEHMTVLRATFVGSGSCPMHLDELRLGAPPIVARASSGLWFGCSGDAVPYTFLLAVERDRLPAGSFAILVTADPGGWDWTGQIGP